MQRNVMRVLQVGEQAVVLCHLPDNKATPYATWRYYVPQGMASCSWGHYAKTFDEALEDFKERCARLSA